jgi:hypothetical protein
MLQFYCPRWGQSHVPWDEFLFRVKQEGYDGIEAGLNNTREENAEMLAGLEMQGLGLIAQHWETVNSDIEKHAEEYERRLKELAFLKPLFINSHTGRDHFTFEENKRLADIAQLVSGQTGIKIIHETHRARFSFAAHIAKEYLQKIPGLRITFDVSHWCNTAESLLEDQQEAVNLAITRSDHIHARIGFAQGPQVPDPRDPRWKKELEFHLGCWDKIIAEKKRSGSPITITPEFGPAPYMMHLPFREKPLADQWEINVYMMNMLKERYS